MHFNIVALETFFTPIPALTIPSPHTFTLTEYERTTADQIPSRIKDADILITTTIPLKGNTLSPDVSPKLKFIAVMAAGLDSIDLKACAERGIPVRNSPGSNAGTVAEHAVALYFACRRFIIPTMRDLQAGEWPIRRTLMKSTYIADEPPRSLRQETVAIFGYGNVGKTVARLLAGLGMTVVVAGRKGDKSAVAEGRVSFEEALRTATVFVMCCPRLPDTIDLISSEELAMMKRDAVLINVSRGDVVNEAALLAALKSGQIGGAAVDVYGQEPASAATCCLLENKEPLNLVVTPHTAWVGGDTTANYQKVLQESITEFISKI